MHHAIHEYYTEVQRIRDYGGTGNESSISPAFFELLNKYARQNRLEMVAQVSIKTPSGKAVTPDGTLKDALRQNWGYWESKDEYDDLDEEIQKKFAQGYPKDNILFEDGIFAVLYQQGEEVLRCSVTHAESLHLLLTQFFSFERPEVKNFRQAIELFKEDVPKVTEKLREIITQAEQTNDNFIQKSYEFLELCQESINPYISLEDVREMIIQHILTEDIFNTIFDETQFHRENNIAKELENVIATFFTGYLKKETLHSIKHYYDAIKAAAATIADHHQKQEFLKIVYETFYKSYNPKAADRLGVVYTPNEIVRFMIESTNYLLQKHFNKYLEDKGVEILDPATGTGTYICDLIDFIRKEKLAYKYEHEIHANEVAILPYYISNLNIEFTYMQKMGKYAEFKNLCFVDTLDNIGGLKSGIDRSSQQFVSSGNLFALSLENSARIKAQNDRKISVIIGNPPYNANQANENDNNKNREYPIIDRRIKETFIKNSNAQKTKLYDMYSRFYRWAFDRLENNGIVAFVTNRSFIDSRTFDGFRKTIQEDFEAAYIIDTKSDVRANPKIAGTTHNVFGIQTGVAIMFLVKKEKRENNTCKINYIALNDFWRKEEKLQWLTQNPLKKLQDRFDIIRPDNNNNWINLAENDFDTLLPLCSKDVKKDLDKEDEEAKQLDVEKIVRKREALFGLYSLGVVTARDEWSYDFSEVFLKEKNKYFVDFYNTEINRWQNSQKNIPLNNFVNRTIKWTEELENHLSKEHYLTYDEKNIILSNYRPFVKKLFYFDKIYTHRIYQNENLFGFRNSFPNLSINFLCVDSSNELATLISDTIVDYCLLKKGNGGTQCLPLYRYDENGNRIDNITDWGLEQFVNHYNGDKITKQDIFHYVYAVLHNPAYRKKYELNLKREFPRIPFYDDFFKWAKWGEQLMELHLNYETVDPFQLRITNYELRDGVFPKTKLKADKEAGIIILDEQTELHGIPAVAWEYKLGNRSALEWILDQYQEKKPKDPTIAEKFNTYRFADYKEQVIDLLKRVCTVSVETMKIIAEMEML